MKEEYIKQVSKKLHISNKAKREIIRDLGEIFDSALENGETEQQVIDRLGAPKEFAESVSGQEEKKVYSFNNNCHFHCCHLICGLWNCQS